MSADWPEVRLEDITSILGDGLHGTPKYEEDGEYFFINGNNLSNGKIVFNENTKRASREEYLKYKKELNERTILVSINGTLGNVAFYNGEKVILGKSACYFNVVDGIDKKFVRYVISSKLFQDYITTYSTGTTIKNVSLKSMRDFTFRLPPINEQKQISKVLGDLDDKIELNSQIIRTLEAMAQAIFKSWFVDFDPVKAKIAAIEAGEDAVGITRAAMYAISGKTDEELDQMQAEQPEHYIQLKNTAEFFPAAMQDSELGEIPEGWKISNFGKVSKCFDKNRVPLSKRQREQKKGSIPYYGATSVMDYVDEYIFEGIYLLLGEDGSVLKDDGSPFTQYIWGKSWVNNHAHVLQGANGVSTEHLMLFVQSQNITAYVTGAVQLKLNQKNMNSIPFINAGKPINDAFYSSIAPFYALKRNTDEEVKVLSKLRDILLPKLFSGELHVDAVEVEGVEV